MSSRKVGNTFGLVNKPLSFTVGGAPTWYP